MAEWSAYWTLPSAKFKLKLSITLRHSHFSAEISFAICFKIDNLCVAVLEEIMTFCETFKTEAHSCMWKKWLNKTTPMSRSCEDDVKSLYLHPCVYSMFSGCFLV